MIESMVARDGIEPPPPAFRAALYHPDMTAGNFQLITTSMSALHCILLVE